MATTNFVRTWKDGDRIFVNVNGATIEVHSFTCNEGNVTLQFRARVEPARQNGDRQQQERAEEPARRRRLDRIDHRPNERRDGKA